MRTRRSRTAILVIVAVIGFGILLGAWLGWQAWQVNRDLRAAVDDAADLQTALEASDQDAIDAALTGLQEHSTAAADRTDSASWSLLTALPRWGDDARGVRLVSDVVADLSNDGLAPLARTATELDALLPQDGAISIAAVRELQAPVEQAHEALARADQRLSAEDPSGFVQQFRDQYRSLAARVDDADHAMASANTALAVLPAMLGEDARRHYLLLFQNNAEIRGTGGMPGALALLETNDGSIELTRQTAPAAFGGERSSPVLPLTPAERRLYGPQLGTYFQDANFTPDFPRTADLMSARWDEVYPERLDGVLSLDPVALSYLLGATGPVQVGDVTLTEDNAVEELLHQVYLRYEDPEMQNAFFRRAASTIFDVVSSGGTAAPRDLLSALARSAEEGRVYVHSFDEAEQEHLAGTRVAGEFVVEETPGPVVNLTMNDTTGSKMSYYLRYDVDVASTFCVDGRQGLTVHARVSSTAPTDAATLPPSVTGGGTHGIKPGNQLVTLRMFAPLDGEIQRFAINSRRYGPDSVDMDGRPVSTAYLLLRPEETIDVSWTLLSGPGQTGATEVTVTPSITEGSKSSTVASAC